MFRAFLILCLLGSIAHAEEGAPAPTTSAPAVEAGDAAAPKSRKPKGKRVREKEAEGSEARDRFQADTVLKSKYQLNGEPLEVDPD